MTQDQNAQTETTDANGDRIFHVGVDLNGTPAIGVVGSPLEAGECVTVLKINYPDGADHPTITVHSDFLGAGMRGEDMLQGYDDLLGMLQDLTRALAEKRSLVVEASVQPTGETGETVNEDAK